jgi:hypothetical protein
MTIPAWTDSAVFLAFIQQVLVPELRPGQVVVLDNLPPPIEDAGCRVIFLPPYTPGVEPDRAVLEQDEGVPALSRGDYA